MGWFSAFLSQVINETKAKIKPQGLQLRNGRKEEKKMMCVSCHLFCIITDSVCPIQSFQQTELHINTISKG